MIQQMRQGKSAFNIAAKVTVIVAVVMILLTHCSSIAADETAAHQNSVINYRSQSNLFATGQGAGPFLIEKSGTTNTSQAESKTATTESKPLLTLMSLSPVGLPDNDSLPAEISDPNSAANLDGFGSTNQPSITDLADTLQWTILLLTAVAAGVIGVHRMTKHKQNTQSNHQMEYQGCLPVRGQFSMHLVTITDRQFLITTDRTGVKTVNALSGWDQFAAPIDPTLDDQFPELSMESKPSHHG